MNTKRIVKLDKDWLQLFYSRVDSELALARNSFTGTHHWIITLTIGGITAVLALSNEDFSYPNEIGFIAVLLVFPLIVRFFVRSCLEYTHFRRWVTIRNNLDQYYVLKEHPKVKKEELDKELLRIINSYYFEGKSPISFRDLIWHNLKLAYLWPLLIVIGLVIIGIILQENSCFITIVMGLVGLILILELIWFFSFESFKQEKMDSLFKTFNFNGELQEANND